MHGYLSTDSYEGTRRMPARRLLILLGAAAFAVAGGISVRRRAADRSMVDWPRANLLARLLAGEPQPRAYDDALTDSYQRVVERSFEAIAAYTGWEMPPGDLPVRVVGRAAWVDVNIANFQTMLGPLIGAYGRVEARAGLAAQLVGTATHYGVTGQIGILLGVLSRRVLGQYDIPLMEPEPERASIIFVESNIRMLAHRLGIRIDDLRMWVALHESTHAFQFQAGRPPWLRGYTSQLLRQYIRETVEALSTSGQLRARLRHGIHKLRRGDMRSAGLLRLALSDGQAAAIGRIQALMTLVEGYSNHVMRATGERVIPDYARLARRMQARERSRGSAFRVLARMLGLEMKLEQYRVGEAFVDHVVSARGLAFVNQAWEGPANVPTLVETHDPAAWVRRLERDNST